jgi:hypothetical protein
MRRMALGLMVLAVCAMMVAPGAMAGKPSGGPAKQYSNCTGDFVAGPTQGEWNYAGNYHWAASGGPIKIWNVPIPKDDFKWGYETDPISKLRYISWNTHDESFMMGKGRAKNGAPLHWAPRELAIGTYQVPGDVIIGVSFYLQLKGWAANGSVWLTIGLYTHLQPLPVNTYVYVQVTQTQIILYGTNIPFTYHDWMHESIDQPPVNYGSTTHSFVVTMDK